MAARSALSARAAAALLACALLAARAAAAAPPLPTAPAVRTAPPPWRPYPDLARVRDAKNKVLAYFASPRVVPDPGWLSLFGYMHRRFALVARGADGRPLHEARSRVARPEVFAIYRRLDDPSAGVEKQQIAALPTAIDRISASALHCDRIPVPDNWVEILRKATRAGGYALTHAVLATEWSVENGCLTRAAVEDLRAEQVIRLADLVERRDEMGAHFEAANDIWIEAVAMLYYGGAKARVRDEWIAALLAQQRPDGGWSREPAAARSDPHAAALALWILLENSDPAPPIRWIRQP